MQCVMDVTKVINSNKKRCLNMLDLNENSANAHLLGQPYEFAMLRASSPSTIVNVENELCSFAWDGILALSNFEDAGFAISNESGITWLSDMHSVEIGTSITSISSYSFGGCSSLQTVIVPTTTLSIAPSAFISCENVRVAFGPKTY